MYKVFKQNQAANKLIMIPVLRSFLHWFLLFHPHFLSFSQSPTHTFIHLPIPQSLFPSFPPSVPISLTLSLSHSVSPSLHLPFFHSTPSPAPPHSTSSITLVLSNYFKVSVEKAILFFDGGNTEKFTYRYGLSFISVISSLSCAADLLRLSYNFLSLISKPIEP